MATLKTNTNGKKEIKKIEEKFEFFMTGKINQSSQGNNTSFNPNRLQEVA